MAIFIENKNVELNQSFGQIINKIKNDFIQPELKHRKIADFKAAGIEIFKDGTHKVYLDDEVQIEIEFKQKKITPNDQGKYIHINLEEIKNLKWIDKKLSKGSAKILVVHFNQNWWIYYGDYKKRKDIEEKFKINQTFTIRGGGYLPLNMRRKGKNEFMKNYHNELNLELPQMWKRHITISQKYTGVMAYDGNYYDLFLHAQELYILGYYYSSIIICRTAAEQALIRILIKVGKAFDIYKPSKGPKKLKSIEGLVETCRSYKLFKGKYPLSKITASKINQISTLASNLSHPKHELGELDEYKDQALKCMDGVQHLIKHHLNFIKDTGVITGYRIKESTKRLK